MARKKSEEEKEYDVTLANVREVLKTKHGKEFVWLVLSECNLYGNNFSTDERIHYMEGKRSIGLYVLQLLEDADPTAYARLLLEKQKLQEGDNGTDRNNND